ncbi:MAG: DUF4159 domain-containing protein [Phycisphaerales bacterium]|nr:DUF4159 domain-containing protein [Phycisphaerales bacterium]
MRTSTYRRILLGLAACALGLLGIDALAGPNLVAVGFFDLAPKLAVNRYSLTDPKTVILEFEGEHNFGRIYVQSNSPRSVVKRDLRAYYSGARGGAPGFMVFDRSGAQNLESPRIWIEFDLKGEIRPGRTYEYECEIAPENDIEGGIPAIMPAFWADGKSYGVQVTLTEPVINFEKIQRLQYIRGTVTIPQFERMTSGASIILKLPDNFGSRFGVQRMTFREIDEELKAGLEPEMPAPIRYIDIKTPVEGQIFDAMEKEREYFLDGLKNNPDHFLDVGDREQSITLTATVVSALGELGDPKLEDPMRKAIDWLVEQAPEQGQFYRPTTIAARLYTVARFGGVEKYRKQITRDMDYLVRAQYDTGGWSSVSWTTQSEPASTTPPDHRTTFVIMYALREAAFAGVDAPSKVWRNAIQYWTTAQSDLRSGGFRHKLEQYGGLSENVSDEYTAMGLTALMVSLEMASGPGSRDCKQFLAHKPVLKGIDAAARWLDERYGDEYAGQIMQQLDRAELLDPVTRLWYFQLLRSISGIPRFNDKDYFRLEAEVLFDPQRGLYDFGSGQFAGGPLATANCMEAFSMGASPTVLQRVVVGDGPDARAYEHSWDAQHATRYMMAQRKRPLNWRRSTINQDVHDWLEVPMMFLNVAGEWKPTKEELAKLREYAFNGGTILVNIVATAEAKRDAVASAVREAFPEYELRAMPADHPAMSIREKIEKPVAAKVLGNGIRDFLFLADKEESADWSCDFHTYRTKKDQSAEKFSFVNNLLDYTLDGAPFRTSFDGTTLPRGSAPMREFRVATLEIGGDKPAYPDLLKTLDQAMTGNYRTHIVSAGTGEAPLLWVMVTGEKPLTVEQKQRILGHIQSGGYLLVDVVTGNAKWGEAALAAIRSLSTDISARPMRTLHPIYTGKIPGTQGFDSRGGPLRKALTSELITQGRNEFTTLYLKGAEFGVFSHYDLSSGLTYNQFPGCRGLLPDEARELVMNGVLAAMQHEKQK